MPQVYTDGGFYAVAIDQALGHTLRRWRINHTKYYSISLVH